MFQIIPHYKQQYPPGHIKYPQRNLTMFNRSAAIASYFTVYISAANVFESVDHQKLREKQTAEYAPYIKYVVLSG